MATSSSTQLVKRTAQDVSLMPPPPFKRIKRPPKVLDEDDYTSALSDIIARDYFPGLLESQAQHEYLAALESGNEGWIAEAGQKMRDAASGRDKRDRRSARNTRFDTTPLRAGDTPVGFIGSDTPMSVANSTISSQQPPDDKKLDTSSLTLSAFQAKYTSEDNESFNTLLDKQNLKRRQKHAYLWTSDQRIPSTQLVEHRAREQRLLQQNLEDEANGKALIPMTVGATSSRPAKPDSWKTNRPDNSFMFPANSVDENGLSTTMDIKQANSKAGAKETVHANTRFPPLQYIDDPGPVPPSPSLNTEIVARRKILREGSLATTTETEFEGGETPRVNGWAFVDEDEPEAIPPQVPAGQEPSYRDLLAGQVGDGTPNPFQLSETRKREELHLRMVEKQARRKREKDREVVRTPLGTGDGGRTPTGNMTPAAWKLMEKLGRTPLRSGVAEGGKERMVDWTPGRTPRRGKVAR
jgi:protein DGCR14